MYLGKKGVVFAETEKKEKEKEEENPPNEGEKISGCIIRLLRRDKRILSLSIARNTFALKM